MVERPSQAPFSMPIDTADRKYAAVPRLAARVAINIGSGMLQFETRNSSAVLAFFRALRASK